MKVCLAMEVDGGGERRFPLTGSTMVLGRDPRCDLRVALPSVELRHCEITIDGEAIRLKDLGSGTGTFHNGTRVDQADLTIDDRLTVGPVTFVVVRMDETASA